MGHLMLWKAVVQLHSERGCCPGIWWEAERRVGFVWVAALICDSVEYRSNLEPPPQVSYPIFSNRPSPEVTPRVAPKRDDDS